MKYKLTVRLAVIALLIVATIVSALGKLDPILDFAGGKRLRDANNDYLDKSFVRAIAGFGIMSVWKASLDIIEGSEVGANIGVSAQLEVGDIVQPAYDYVDIAWRTMFVAATTLMGAKFLLQAAAMIDGYVLTLGLTFALLCAAASLWPRLNRVRIVLFDAASITLVLAMSLLFVLPLSVWGGSKLSAAITQPSIVSAQNSFAAAKEELFPETQTDQDGWVKKIKAIPERIEQIGTYLRTKAYSMMVWTVRLVAAYIFDCIIFPIALFIIIVAIVRGVMRYVLHITLARSIGDDLKAALMNRK